MADRSIIQQINERGRKDCSKGLGYRIAGFQMNDTTCTIEFELESSIHVMETHKHCNDSLTNTIEHAVDDAWGMSWGCRGAWVKTKVTPFYTISRWVEGIQTLQDEVTVTAMCNFPLVKRDSTFQIQCKMNSFGGYEWQEDKISGCYIDAFDQIAENNTKILTQKLIGSVKCGVLYMHLYGQLKQGFATAKSTKVCMQRATEIFTTWEKYCYNMTPITNKIYKSVLFEMAEFVINGVVSKVSQRSINGKEFYALIFLMLENINRHVITDSTPKSVYVENSNLITVYRFNEETAPHAESKGLFPNRTQFYVESLRMQTPLDVTCLEIAAHQAYVKLISMRPISALCYIGSFSGSSLKVFENGFQIHIEFKLDPELLNRELECAAIEMSHSAELQYNRGVCITKAGQAGVNCTCSDYGFFMVSQVTSRSENLKTDVPNHLRENIFLLILFFFNYLLCVFAIIVLVLTATSKFLSRAYKARQNRFYPAFRNFGILMILTNLLLVGELEENLIRCGVAEYCLSRGPALLSWIYLQILISTAYTLGIILSGRTHRLGRMMWHLSIVCIVSSYVVYYVFNSKPKQFLNYLCMPLNLSLCITTPKFVSVCINTVLLMNYLRLAKRRYMDEWIGSLIYVVGDIVCLIIGVLTRFVEPGDENEQAYLFISYFVFTRTLLCICVTVYTTFLKMSMLTFYHRVTQVLYCKRRLKVVVDQQLHSHFFGLINTFAERETRSRGAGRWSFSRSPSTTLSTTISTSDVSTISDFSTSASSYESSNRVGRHAAASMRSAIYKEISFSV